jgi:cytochrome P450
MQWVIVVGAEAVNAALGNGEGLSKALEPDLSDKLLSHRPGHRTMFSADTNSPYWRLIRKGAAPAFKAEHIRRAH